MANVAHEELVFLATCLPEAWIPPDTSRQVLTFEQQELNT